MAGRPFLLSYGVESGGMAHEQPITFEEKMSCTALKFKHPTSQFQIAGVPIDQEYLYVNYDRRAHILIGMDILGEWDIHIGTSRVWHDKIFLGCPNRMLCDEYNDALKTHFGLNRDEYGDMEHLH